MAYRQPAATSAKEDKSRTISIRTGAAGNNPARAHACLHRIRAMVGLSNRAANGTMLASASKIAMRSGRKKHARDEESGAGRPDRCVPRLGGCGGGAGDQADACRPELSDRMGALARAAALGE